MFGIYISCGGGGDCIVKVNQEKNSRRWEFRLIFNFYLWPILSLTSTLTHINYNFNRYSFYSEGFVMIKV